VIRKFLTLIAFFVIVFAFVLAGGHATGLTSTSFFKSFLRAFWGQSTWLVPPSWALVYSLVAVSGWLAFERAPGMEKIFPMMLFGGILTANASWWWIYYEVGNPQLALMNLGVLWGLIFFTLFIFALHSRWAAALMIPYFAWISYAFVFNFFKIKF